MKQVSHFLYDSLKSQVISIRAVNSSMWRRKRKIHCSDTLVMYAGGGRRRGGGGGSDTILKQLTWKFKSQWKQAIARHTTTSNRHGYDPQSYSQNFDDGFLYDHLYHSHA
ncbi:hypothetical protein QVD17_17266 [Tagetes erecta]|uniref:Uncharacterized protein n=1 Tax=Tagetes erecta TaxID=13708 RepID=A0AAD8P1A4_TARER|nr:hypothetical protein QVD17_17266 [Tagetes erecta]